MNDPIRIGLVGLGRAGSGMHRPEIRPRLDKFHFYAVCDIIEERTQPFVEEFGSKPYTNIEDLLADPGVELVVIATRSCDHYRHAKMALQAGKHVLLEKPFCMHPDECEDLIRLGSQPGGPHLYIRHNRRFERGFCKVTELIDSGILGDVFEIRLTRNGYGRRSDWQTLSEFGGGQLLNWGPHIIDHSLRFCGGAYTDMYSAIRHTVAAGDCEDHIKIVFTGVNGRIVDMEISGGVATPTPVYQIYGTRGTLVSDLENEEILHLHYVDPECPLPDFPADPDTPGAKKSEKTDADEEPVFVRQTPMRWVDEDVCTGGGGDDRMWDHLYEAFRHSVKYPIELSQALAVVQVIEQVKKNTIFENKRV